MQVKYVDTYIEQSWSQKILPLPPASLILSKNNLSLLWATFVHPTSTGRRVTRRRRSNCHLSPFSYQKSFLMSTFTRFRAVPTISHCSEPEHLGVFRKVVCVARRPKIGLWKTPWLIASWRESPLKHALVCSVILFAAFVWESSVNLAINIYDGFECEQKKWVRVFPDGN